MEWQTVYFSALALNAVLMEPLTVFSPAFLYDGQVVMHLASTSDIERQLFKYDIDMRLYELLKDTVFGETLLDCSTYLPKFTVNPSMKRETQIRKKSGLCAKTFRLKK